MSEQEHRMASTEELAREAAEWDRHVRSPHEWADAPEAIPRAGASTTISLRVPNQMLSILREFARREGAGYQVLMKRWLDERISVERGKFARTDQSKAVSRAAGPASHVSVLEEDEIAVLRHAVEELEGLLAQHGEEEVMGEVRGRRSSR